VVALGVEKPLQNDPELVVILTPQQRVEPIGALDILDVATPVG
jgi:hypothetical protein